MKFSTAALLSILCATSVLAAPHANADADAQAAADANAEARLRWKVWIRGIPMY